MLPCPFCAPDLSVEADCNLEQDVLSERLDHLPAGQAPQCASEPPFLEAYATGLGAFLGSAPTQRTGAFPPARYNARVTAELTWKQ